jgi:hypothetical protein
MLNYVVRPSTGEVFPPERAEELLLSDRSLRIATNEEQREIVAGRDFRAIAPKQQGGHSPFPNTDRFRVTEATIPVPVAAGAAPAEPADATTSIIGGSMDVALGKLQPNPNAVPQDNADPESQKAPLAEQLEAIDLIEDLDALRSTADQLGAEWKPTMNRETVRTAIKKRLIALANAESASAA